MAFKNIFKKQKKQAKAKEKPSVEVFEGVETAKEKTAKKTAKKTPQAAPRALFSSCITEKAMSLADQNQYVFKVSREANKIEIKKAINEIYGIKAKKIRIINIPRKQRRLGKVKGWRQAYKKAVVTLPKGQKIDIV